MPEPEMLLSGLGIPESPRWHEGRLWFANWIGQQIVAVRPDGAAEYLPTPVDRLMGWSIGWLPDGRLLTTGDKLRRQEPDGHWATLADQAANEIVVDGRGHIYLNGADFNFAGGEAPKPGWIKLVTPDGQVRQVAGDIQFPNGMVITPDNRTLIISESFAGGSPHSTSTGMVGCPTGGCSPVGWARTASAWTPTARSGCPVAGSGWSGSHPAARSCSASSWPRTGRRSR